MGGILVLAPHFESDVVYLKVRYFGRSGPVYLLSPGKEIGFPHIAGINDSVFGKGKGNIAVPEIQLLNLSQEVVAVAWFSESIEQTRGLQITDVIWNGVAAESQIPAESIIAGLEWDALGKDVHQFLEFYSSGNGHVGIIRDVVLYGGQNGILQAYFGIVLLKERIESRPAVFFVVLERTVIS